MPAHEDESREDHLSANRSYDSHCELPTDSDIEVGDDRVHPSLVTVHRLRSVAWVGLGGAFGAGVRYLITQSGVLSVPWVTMPINIVGALLLGVLLEDLAGRGADHGWRRTIRLLLGTGFLGGFTTYSTLAVDTDLLLRQGLWGSAAAYAGGTLLIGAVASFLGIVLASRLRRSEVSA